MKCMIKYGFMTLVSVVSFASSSFASATPGYVTLCAKQVRPGLILLLR